MKSCLTLLLKKYKSKLQWDITYIRYHLYLAISARIALIKKSTNNKCWRGCGEKGFLHCWWEGKLVQPLWRIVWRALKKLKIELPYIWPCIPTSEYIFREKHDPKRNTNPNVHCSTVYKSQDTEATQVSMDRGMDKEDVVHIYNGILLSH